MFLACDVLDLEFICECAISKVVTKMVKGIMGLGKT